MNVFKENIKLNIENNELKEENEKLKQRLKYYESERNQYKEDKILELINLYHTHIKDKIKTKILEIPCSDIKNYELLFKMLKERD